MRPASWNCGAVTDITAAKEAEEKIRQSEKEARQLLDLSPLHIAELGPDGARLYTNRASLDYCGITLEEWQDADLQQLLHPQDAELVTNDLPGKLQSGSPFEYEARLKRKDGQYRWFHYRLSPMSDEEGASRGGMPQGPISMIASWPSKGSRKRIWRCAKKSIRHRCSKRSWEVPSR